MNMRLDIVSALVPLVFVVTIACWIVLLAKAIHFPFWAAVPVGGVLGWGTVMLLLLLPSRRKKKR